MAVRLSILGCCASRDWVLSQRRGAGRLLAGRPAFHSSALAVQFLPALPSLPEIDQGLGRGDQATIRRDLMRTWPAEMLAFRPDVVLVDLCYEAAGWLVHSHGGWFTRSISLRNSAVMEAALPEPLRPEEDPAQFVALVGPAYAAFARFMADHLPDTRIMLHRVRYATDVRGRFGRVRPFAPVQQDRHRQINAMLDRTEALFLQHVPNCELLQLDGRFVRSELQHRWGLHGIHYVEGYYRRFLSVFARKLGHRGGVMVGVDRIADGLSEARRRWREGIRPQSEA